MCGVDPVVSYRPYGPVRAGRGGGAAGRHPRRLQTLHRRQAAAAAGPLGQDPHEGDGPAHDQHATRRARALHQARLARGPAAALPRDV